MGEEDVYCGTIMRKCKTLDQAIRLTVTDNDAISEIILDGGDSQRNIYTIAYQNIEFNKSLVIRSKAKSNKNPLVQHLSAFIATIFIFTEDSTGMKVESVDWENIILAKISHTKNIYVELNNCHFNMPMGVGFIHFGPDIKGINFKICDSEIYGNWKWESNVPIIWDFGTLDGDSNAQFINSSFKSVGIAVKGLRDLHIEECFFKNGVILIQDLRYLYIAGTVFDVSSSSYIIQDTFNGPVLLIHSSNASIINCTFSNNKKSVMYLFSSTVSIENTTFINNSFIRNGNFFSQEAFLAANLANVTLWKVTFYQNEFYKTLFGCKDCNVEIKNSLIKKTTSCVQIVLVHSQNKYSSTVGFFTIVDTLFSENTCDTALVRNDGLYLIDILDTIISFNKAGFIIVSHRQVSLRKTKLNNNNVEVAVGARSLFIQSCNFENNTVKRSLIFVTTLKVFTWIGGGEASIINNTNITMNIISNDVIEVWFEKQKITIHRLNVLKNSFRSCFAVSNGKVLIHNSVINNNNATGVGKLTNFHEKSSFSASEFFNIDKGLEMKNVRSSFNADELENPVILIELQNGFLRMENVTLQLSEAIAIHTLPVIDIATDRRNLNVTLDLKVSCPVNYNPSNSTHISARRFGYRLSCDSCPRGLYSSHGGSEYLNDLTSESVKDLYFDGVALAGVSSVKNSTNCIACPPGATCNYKLLSRGNFYGFINKNGKYEFITCPKNYCCSQEGAPCTSYNTCNVNRNGLLCGSCTEGNYISYFSNKCVEASKCTASNRLMFWMFYFGSATSLTLVLCFVEDLLNVLKMILLFIKRKILKKSVKRNQEGPKNGENSEMESLQIHNHSSVAHSNENQTQKEIPNQISYSAIFNILASFYQLQNLLQVPVDDKDQWSFTSLISNFFNLNIMLRRVDKFCPSKSKIAICRDVLKNLFLPLSMVFTILIIMYIRKFCVFLKARFPKNRLLNVKHFQKSLSLTERLYVGYYVVITISYEKLASIAFRLIHCVEIEGSKVLYFAGDVECYKNWQKLDICFLVIWIIPFPAAVIAGYCLLKKNKISAWIFMTCVTFPPLIIVIFIAIKYSTFIVKVKSKGEHEGSINRSLQDIFEEPYLKKYFWWEAWTLYERLIVACIATFLIDPVIRLCSLAPVFLLFLWFHHWAKPYKSSMKILFHLDVLSYICLCFNLVSNMIRAIAYIYSLPLSQYPIDKALEVSLYLEYIFSPLWLLIAYFMVVFAKKKLKKHYCF